MAGLSTGAPIVQVYHEKSRILPDVSRVLACLYEKGVKFNPHMTSNKSLLKLQAATHAPVPFYDGPTFLEESREICRHIAEKYEHHGYPFLLGKDALERASVEQWLHNEEHAFNPPSRALFCHLAFPPDKDDNVDDIDIHKRKLEEVLEVYEQRLSDNEFLAGNMFTLADLVHLPNSHYITAASEFVYLYDSRKNVRRWWDAISKRGSWQKVLMYMEEVEEQNKQDELKEQQQQKNHPKTPGYPLQIRSTKHTKTEPRTVLMHPAGTVSSSPIAPQTEKPLPIDIPDEPLVSSSQSTPTDHETSVTKSKETPFQEKPPQKSPIPVQSTIAPATSRTTSEKSPIVGAARFSTKDTSNPEPGAGYGGGQDTNKQLRDPDSIARQTATQSTFGESKAADSMISSEGSSDAFQFPHPRHDLDAARHTTAPFQKRYPLTEDTTKQTKDIISAPWQMADQETEDTENATKERAEAPSEKHETTEGLVGEKETTEDHHGATSPIHKRHANIKDTVGQYRDVAFKPKKMISQDDGDALKETKFRDPSLLKEQPSDTQQAATTTDEENQDGLNMALPSKRTQTIYPSVTASRTRYPIARDPSKQPRGTPSTPRHKAAQDENDTLPTASPLGAQDALESKTPTADHQRMDVSTQLQSDAQDTFLQSKLPAADQKGLGSLTFQERGLKDLHATPSEEKPVSSERPREMIKKSQSTAPKAHPIDSQGSIKVERVPFLHEEKHLSAHDNQDQAQIIPSGGKGDDSTPEREEASDALYNDEKLSAAAPAKAKSRNDFNAEESHKKDTIDDQKVASSLRSEEPISLLQPPSGPSQDADPHGDLSSKLSTIEQWQHVSAPLNDMTTNSRDETGMPTLDQKPTPRSQQGSHSGHGANQMAKEPRVEAPILPIEPETSDVQSTSPSFPEAATTDHAFVDDKFAKQSIIDERLGEPKQMEAPITDARPASPPTKRKTPDSLETDDLEHVGSSDGQISNAAKATPLGPVTIREDSHDASIGEKTTKYDASGDQLVTGPLDEQTRPPALTHEAKEPIGGRRTSKEPQPRRSSQAEVARVECKSTLSDQKLARSVQPLSPVEPVNIDSNDDTITPQMTFRQQARPSAPIIRGVPTSDRQSVTRKIQEVTPDYHHTEDSGKPLIPSQEDQISHASQAIPPQEDTKYSPSARDSPKSDIQPSSAQVHEVAHNDQKVVSPLPSKELTSQVQPPSGPSQDEDPHGDLSSQLSTIKQWKRALAPLNDMTTSSRDAMDIPTTDQKSTPLSQQESRNGHSANQMVKESGEQRVGTPILRIEPETSGVQSTSPSFPEAATTDHAIIDDKFAKQSIMDERLGEPKQMQAPITDARPASPPTKRKTPNDPEIGDLEVAGSSEGQILDAAKATPPGPTTIREYSHDAAIDEKTTKYDASGDQLVTRPLDEQARPPALSHEAKESIGGRRTSKEPRLHGSSQAEVARAERKSTLSDQKPARSVQPLSPVEPVNIDSNDYEADDTIAPQMTLRQQARPSAPIIKAVPTSDSSSVKRKIQEVIPNYGRTEDSGQVHEVSRDESSEKQGSHVGSTFGPNELGPIEKKFVPSDQGLGHSADDPSSADPRKEYHVAPTVKQIKALPGIIGQQGTPETREVPSSGDVLGTTSEDALDTISTNVDVHPTASTKAPRRSFSVQGAEPTSSAQAPPFHVAHESLHSGTTPDDALENAVSMKRSASPDAQHSIVPGNTTDEVTPAEHKFVPSGQDSVHSKQSPPSAVQRNEVIGDSTPETQQIFSMRPRKGDVATPDEAKGTRTPLDQHEMLSAPLRSVPPSSDTQRPSEKARGHISADDLGEAASKPPSDIREVRQPTVVPASAPAARHGVATDEEALDKQKSVPSGQDFVHSTQPPSSSEQRNGRIGDSASSTQWISSTKPNKGDVASTPDQAKDSEITLRGQDLLPPARSVSPSSDIQRPSGKAHDVPANDLGEAKPIVQASAPDTQDETARDEATPGEKEFAPPEPISSTEPRNEEIRDSAPSTQLISSSEKMKENTTIGTPDQAKDTQITPGRQDILPPVTLESPSSDTQRPSGKVHEDVPADDDLREAKPILQASAPDTQDERKIVPSEPTSSTEPRNKEIRDSAPSTQLISSTGTRNEDAIIAAPDQDKDLQTTLDQQDILSAPVRSASPSSDNQHPSEKAQEDALADDLREAASKSLALVREVRPPTVVPASGPATLHGAAPDETAHDDEQKIVASGQDSAQSVQPSFSSEQTKEDTIVTAADQTEDLQTIIHGQNITPSTDTTKTPLPGEEQVLLGRDEGHAIEPYRATVDEKTATSPSSKEYSSESGSDLTQTHTDVHPSIGEGPTETFFPEHGLQTQPPLATQDISLGASNKTKSAGQKAKAPIASASETQPGSTQPQDEAAPIEQNFVVSGNRDTRQTPDARETLSKSQESSRDDDGISNVADPLVSQEQASRAERASEGPTEKGRSATVDEKTTLPSSQAQTSNTGPDSTLATGDAHLTNAEMPATSFLQNQEAQPLAATQAPTNQAPPSSSQNVHADPLENIETPRQPSKAPPAPVTSSAAYSDTPNGEPGTATLQTPQEASFDLSGGEKTTTTQGDQVNPLLNGDLSTSQPVKPSESAGFKGTNSEWKLEGASTYEKSKAQHQTDHYEIPSSKDNNKEANEAIRSDLWHKENMESSGESEHQEQADQAVVQSPDGNVKEQTKTRDTETGALEERDPQENTNQTNSEVSRMEALDSSGKQTSGVQLRGENRNDASHSADDAPEDIQTRRNSEDNLTSYEEANKVQQQAEGKTQGGETEAPLSDTVQQNGRGLPENSYQNNSSQSQAEVSDKSAEKFSPGIQNKNKSSSGLDSPTDGT